MKVFPFNPIRFCLKINGPFDFNFVITAIIKISGDRVGIAREARITSRIRFV